MKGIITTGIIALTALAAGDASAQESWQLAQVNGSALPAVIEQDDDDCRDEVVSGTLTLRDNGTWVFETREREVCGSDVDEENESEDGRFTRDAGALVFMDDDGNTEDDDNDDDDGIDVDDFVSGSVDGSGLTVQLDDGNTLTFRR